MADVDFFFDFISPYTYLARTQLDGIAARTGARFRMWPMHILNLMKTVGILPQPWSAATSGSTPGRTSEDGALGIKFP
jgi:2-hydroxychromene-2-carboxylate isomerase